MSVNEVTDTYSSHLSIDQIVITRTPTEVSVVSSSLPDAAVEQGWLEVLVPFLSATPRPSNSITLAYIRFTENWAAVLGQHAVDNSGNLIMHALVGQADLLTAGLALTLSQWSGWHTTASRDVLQPLRPDQLRQGIDVAGSLRAQVLNDPNRLARVLGWLFQNPYAPLAVVGCPVSDRIPLLWALVELGAPVCPGRPWTFWTEAHGADDWWPDLVFLSSRPDDPGDRIVVDLERDQWPEPTHAHQANRLVFRLKYGYYPDRPATPSPALPTAGTATPPPPAPAAAPTQETVPIRPSIQAEANRLAAALRGATNATELAVCLTELEQAAADPDFRRGLRTALAGTDHGVARVRALMEAPNAPHVYERIVLAMFGPALVDLDTLSGADQAAALVRDVDDDFLRSLVQVARRHGQLRQLTSPIGLRWVNRIALANDRGAEPGALARIGRILGGPPSMHRQGALAVSAVLLVVLAAVAGFAVGRPAVVADVVPAAPVAPATPVVVEPPVTQSSVSQPSVTPPPVTQVATTPPAVAQPNPADVVVKGTFPRKNLVVSGKTTPLNAGESLWLLEARDNPDGQQTVYYAQPQPCKAAVDGTWSCTQTVPVPAAQNNAVNSIMVVRADVTAGGAFDKHEKPGSAEQFNELPAGAVPVVRLPE